MVKQKQTAIRSAIGALAIGAVSLIAYFEGFRGDAYLPTKNDVPTIGYGQTHYSDGKKVRLGETITEGEAREELTKLVKKYSVSIDKCIKVPLKQNEYDAYLSLAYNIGSGAFCRSTLIKKLNAKDYKGACDQILVWKYQKGKVLKGLENRRKKEYEKCIE